MYLFGRIQTQKISIGSKQARGVHLAHAIIMRFFVDLELIFDKLNLRINNDIARLAKCLQIFLAPPQKPYGNACQTYLISIWPDPSHRNAVTPRLFLTSSGQRARRNERNEAR